MRTKAYKKGLSLAMVLLFIVSLLSPVAVKTATADVISVKDAIANNSGSNTTVEGYIVGTVREEAEHQSLTNSPHLFPQIPIWPSLIRQQKPKNQNFAGTTSSKCCKRGSEFKRSP